MKKWEELPRSMQNDDVRYYYDILQRHKVGIRFKRIFDIIVSAVLLIVLFPVFLVISIMIKIDSKGPVLFKQIRITAYGRKFRILKFRTMIEDADKLGAQVTTRGDRRITKVGHMLRKFRLDELPQLLNILSGDMTFVGTRPEVPKYTKVYTDKMKATWLLPAGVTSRTSIEYKDEERLLKNAECADDVYIYQILPSKMKYNLKEIEKFSFFRDLETMMLTVIAVVH